MTLLQLTVLETQILELCPSIEVQPDGAPH